MKECGRLYSDFYKKFSLLLSEYEKENIAVAKKESPFIHDGEEESMMDSVLNERSKPLAKFLNDWGSPLWEYRIEPILSVSSSELPLVYTLLTRNVSRMMNFRLSVSIPEKKTNEEILIVPNNPEFFDRLRILARARENLDTLTEGLCNMGIEITFTKGLNQEADNLLTMVFYDSQVIYDGIVLETAPDKRDVNALQSLLKNILKANGIS